MDDEMNGQTVKPMGLVKLSTSISAEFVSDEFGCRNNQDFNSADEIRIPASIVSLLTGTNKFVKDDADQVSKILARINSSLEKTALNGEIKTLKHNGIEYEYVDVEYKPLYYNSNTPPMIKTHTYMSYVNVVLKNNIDNVFGIDVPFDEYEYSYTKDIKTASHHFQWGNKMEILAIKSFEKLFNTKVFGMQVLFKYSKNNQIMCLVDGLAEINGKIVIVSIKCPYSGRLPNKPDAMYIDQSQTEMMCSEIDTTYLFYYTPMKARVFVIEKDENRINEILGAIEEFKTKVRNYLGDWNYSENNEKDKIDDMYNLFGNVGYAGKRNTKNVSEKAKKSCRWAGMINNSSY